MKKSKQNSGLAAEITKRWREFLDCGPHRGFKVSISSNGHGPSVENFESYLDSLGLSRQDYANIFQIIPKERVLIGEHGTQINGNNVLAVGSLNIQQGIRYEEVIETLQTESELNMIFCQEVTRNHKWADYQDLADKIVKETKYNHVFYSPSFIFSKEPKPFPEIGNAILSKHRLSNGRVIRLGHIYDWSKDKPYPKVGERTALYATVQINGNNIEACSTHLELRGSTSSRLRQLEQIFEHADSTGNHKVIIGGDFNEWSLNMPKHEIDGITMLARARGYKDPFGESSERTVNNFWFAIACYILRNAKFTNDRVLSRGFEVKGYQVVKEVASTDHFLIKTFLGYK